MTYLTKSKLFKWIFFVFYPIHFYVQFFIKVMKPFLELATNELKPKITYFITKHFEQSIENSVHFRTSKQNFKRSGSENQKILLYQSCRMSKCNRLNKPILDLWHSTAPLDIVAFLFAFVSQDSFFTKKFDNLC